MPVAVLVRRGHFERMQHDRLSRGEPLDKARPAGRRSSETRRCRDACRRSACRCDRKRCRVSSMKPSPPSGTMISASLRRDAGIDGCTVLRAPAARPRSRPRRRRSASGWRSGHPPVTLIWRATAGRLWRRSMMKSWPLGLRSIASRIAASSASSPSDWRSGVRRSAASSWPRHM